MTFENITVFDFETTGLDPVNDRIIEIAAIRIVNGKLAESFSTFVHPEIKIPAKITEITGIVDADVAGQPKIEEVLPPFMQFLGNSIIVAHNAAFDLSFLVNKLSRFTPPQTVDNDFIDTRGLCIKHFPYQAHKLDVMCQKMGVVLEGAHRALNDVTATANLLLGLEAKFGGTENFINKIYYYRKYPMPKGLPKQSVMIGV